MRNLAVEISSKEGVRIERIRLDNDGLKIGRAWNSDIVVRDRFVDANHLGLSLDEDQQILVTDLDTTCLLYTSPSPRDQRGSRMPSSA